MGICAYNIIMSYKYESKNIINVYLSQNITCMTFSSNTLVTSPSRSILPHPPHSPPLFPSLNTVLCSRVIYFLEECDVVQLLFSFYDRIL